MVINNNKRTAMLNAHHPSNSIVRRLVEGLETFWDRLDQELRSEGDDSS